MRFSSATAIAALTCLIAGCATHGSAKTDAARTLSSSSRFDGAYSSATAAEKSYQWGDKYTATNLLVQADKANPSIRNRFNLAVAYDAVGESGAAAELFAQLIKDGQYVRLPEIFPYESGSVYTHTFNVADESQKRLDAIQARPQGPTGALGADSRIANSEALKIDQNLEDQRSASGVRVTPH